MVKKMRFFERDLYEIDCRLDACLDPETGELLDEAAFRALQMDRTELLENLLLWYKNTAAFAKDVREEALALTKRAQTLEARAEAIKSRAAALLEGRKFHTARVSASFRASSAAEVEDPARLTVWAVSCGHADCVVERPPAVDRLAVKNLLKSGVDVPGARLVQRQNLVVK